MIRLAFVLYEQRLNPKYDLQFIAQFVGQKYKLKAGIVSTAGRIVRNELFS
ncbi:hypothetical protein NC99_03010 [Sunxiuqinia dokdonensis]|uniref:Uncharacterized protein n=1 Tax=Sunxiuqinia dokdonensis TaxID=1409788 RepID=A0A0L8VEL6_9BACT|nr:hypothetical protein NC99_03010 [Sunxiuqinia dokdonensis]